MNIIFYILIFTTGSICGSFFASIIQNITKNERAFKAQSNCCRCGSKLSFWERIPILSYIFLKGRCKHCKEKINISYIILEVLTGFLFVAFTYALKVNINTINSVNITSLIFTLLYLSYIILEIGIDKESRTISRIILAYGIGLSLIYLVYEYLLNETTVYVQMIYLIIIIALLLIDIINTKKQAKNSYVTSLLMMLLIMLIFTGEVSCILTIGATLIAIALYVLIKKIQRKNLKNKNAEKSFSSEVKIGFIMGVLNIVIFLLMLILY